MTTDADAELLTVLRDAIKYDALIVVDCILGRNGQPRALSMPLPVTPPQAAAWQVREELKRRIQHIEAELTYLHAIADYPDATFEGECLLQIPEQCQ